MYSLCFQSAATEYLISKGADKKKIILGIPFYGQTFTLKSPKENTIGSDVTGPGNPGPYTKQPGMAAYYEICYRSK